MRTRRLAAVLLAVGPIACSQEAPQVGGGVPVRSVSQSLIEDAAHSNAANFTFLPSVSKPSRAVRDALHLRDPAYFFAGADPVLNVDEYYLEDPATGAVSFRRPIAQYTTRDRGGRAIVTEEGGFLFGDNVIAERARFYRARLDLDRFERELGLKPYPFIYRMSVIVRGVTVGFADVALAKVEVVHGRRKCTLQIRDLKKRLECDEKRLPPGRCTDDYVVLDDDFDLTVRFWMNRCAGKDLAAKDACHETGSCNPLTGEISYPKASPGSACDDATVCNGHETCDGNGTCTAGTPLTVPPATACTSYVCDPVKGIVAGPLACGGAYAPFETGPKAPLAYWDMETLTPEGYIADLAGSNPLGIVGSPVRGEPGVLGAAYRIADAGSFFVSVNDYPTSLDGAAAKSLSGWIKLGSSAGDGDGSSPLLSFGGGGISTGYTTFGIATNWGNEYFVCFYPCDIPTTAPVSLGVWHHLAATYDGATVTVYLDGVVTASGARTLDTRASFAKFVVGASSWWSTLINHLADGAVDELKVFGFALTADEVQQLYQLGLADMPTTPLSLSPQAPAACTGSRIVFGADGGNPPYTFSVVSGGGSFVYATTYEAPDTPGSATVRVTDAMQREAETTIAIVDGGSPACGRAHAPFETGPKAPLAYWDMESLTPEGYIADLAGSNPLRIVGNPVPGEPGVLGATYRIADAGSFFVSVDDYPTSLDGAAAKSLSAWINLGSSAGDGDGSAPLLSFGGGGTSTGFTAFGIATNWGNEYFVCFYLPCDIPTTAPVSLGVWHHLAATYDGVTVTVYLDGVVTASGARTLDTRASFAKFVVGASSWWSTLLNHLTDGAVDELKVFGFALTAYEVQQLYQLGVADMLTTPQP